jgi:hypothetical protein
MIERKRENAKINNNAVHTGDNGYNALQQSIKPILKNAQMRSRLGPDLTAKLMDMNEGSVKLNAMRRFGSFVNGHNNFLPFLMGQDAFLEA